MWRDARRRFGANGLWRVCWLVWAVVGFRGRLGAVVGPSMRDGADADDAGSCVVSCGRFYVRGDLKTELAQCPD